VIPDRTESPAPIIAAPQLMSAAGTRRTDCRSLTNACYHEVSGLPKTCKIATASFLPTGAGMCAPIRDIGEGHIACKWIVSERTLI
jgi:hypothetical protein